MDPIEGFRDWAEKASTLEWGLAVVAATALVWFLGFALNKLFGPKKPRPS